MNVRTILDNLLLRSTRRCRRGRSGIYGLETRVEFGLLVRCPKRMREMRESEKEKETTFQCVRLVWWGGM